MTPSEEDATRRLPLWQSGILLLILLAFLGASAAFLQPRPSTSSIPPVLFLAEDDQGVIQLHLANPPNWQATQLSQETAVILNYALSPDGTQIAYATALPDGRSQIKLLRLDSPGTPKTVLACAQAECSQPVWHPDGRRLLYERREPPSFNRPQLLWLDTLTGDRRPLLEEEAAIGSNARFSPDGRWVAFAGSPAVGLQLYSFIDKRLLTFPSDVGTPAAWHPLGNQLLFQNSRTVVFHGENNDQHDEHGHDFGTAVSLYLGTINNETNLRLLSADGVFNDGNPAWSPDGQWIAFGRRLAGTNTGRQLWLMRPDGSEARALTDDIMRHHGPPTWSPDGRFLLFQQYDSRKPDESPSIWLLEIASGEAHQISKIGALPAFLITLTPSSLSTIVVSSKADINYFMHTFYYPTHVQHDPARLHRKGDNHWNRYYAEVAQRGVIIHHAVQAAQFGPISNPGDFGLSPIQDVHAHQLITLLQNAHDQMKLETGREVAIPETFSLRPRSQRHLYSIFGQLGRYCFDTSSPIFAETWEAAYWSVQTAVSAAALIAANPEQCVYALSRPPGHHAAADQFGGFCYLNNVAIAANWLVQQGQRVAILDIDYHHGNGTQEIFYGRSNVLFVSIHADPRYEYPYFWGFADEFGDGPGLGFNHNYPLPPNTQANAYLETLARALVHIRAYVPDTLLVSLGVDTGQGDPTGTFLLKSPDFFRIGQQIGQLNLPTAVVQEGGYKLDSLGELVTAFLRGLLQK